MPYLVAVLIVVLVSSAWTLAGAVIRIATAIEAQNKHFGIGAEPEPEPACEFCGGHWDGHPCSPDTPCPARVAAEERRRELTRRY